MRTQAPAPGQGKINRKRLAVVAAAALVAVAAIVAAFLLLFPGENSPYPVRSTMIPGAQLRDLQTPQAMRYNLDTAEAAQAYFERLLDSNYIGLRGDAKTQPQKTETGWTVSEENGDGTMLSAAFDSQGIVSSLSIATSLGGEMRNAKPPYVLGNGDESLFTYIRAFAYEYLPDVVIDSGSITADTYNDEGRFVTVVADNQLVKGAYRFVVQIDPVQRIVGFETLVDPAQAFIRSSRMATTDNDQTAAEPAALKEPLTEDTAAQLARSALAAALGLPADVVNTYVLVDVTRYEDSALDWYGTVYSGAYWLVNFRMPQTPEAFYSDYSVFLDDETGEVLRILDPSNISNG